MELQEIAVAYGWIRVRRRIKTKLLAIHSV